MSVETTVTVLAEIQGKLCLSTQNDGHVQTIVYGWVNLSEQITLKYWKSRAESKLRMLISVSPPAASWLWCLLPWVMVWTLSGIGAVWGCVRVLYLWEPITPLHSPRSVSFWRHRKQADLHLYRVCHCVQPVLSISVFSEF